MCLGRPLLLAGAVGLGPFGRRSRQRKLTPARSHARPQQVLDAPALADDYYLNLVDWSSQNVLAVGLGTCVYLWSACTSKVTRLVDFGEGGAVCRWGLVGGCRCGGECCHHVLVVVRAKACLLASPRRLFSPLPPASRPPFRIDRSVSWSQRGSFLSIGSDKGEVQIWDAAKCKR